MARIRILPPELISRIAAGECVERPASVVKELVENALDAGAQRIDVVTLDGGRELIQVSDDGGGMDREDLELSVAQHATSKLGSDDDLFAIHTMGFRGEALASIGAVARLQITSRRAESDVGYVIRVDGGRLTPAQPCTAPVGTTVEVRDLFFCVPARRKFLRTNQTESGHVNEQLARIALAHPGVAFSLRSQNRVVHQLAATPDRRVRIRDLFGPELADVLLPVQRASDGLTVDGYAAPPAESRGAGGWEYVFVNGRFVRDRFVSHAIKEAYRSLIDPRRYPVAFIFISIDPAAVDVNVHPTKTEVRWRDSNLVHAQVLAALRDRFLTTRLDHDLKPAGDDDAYQERVRQALVDFFAKPRPAAPGLPFGRGERGGAESRAVGRPADAQAEGPVGAPGTAPVPPTASGAAPPPAPTPAGAGVADDAVPTSGVPRAIQVHNSYIVVETADGLEIVDQHALHERILYESLSRRVRERPLEAQRLLLPEIVRVPPDRLEALETHADLLARVGVELNAAGPQSVALQAFPTLLLERRVDQGAFVRDLLDRLAERGARPDADTLVHQVLDMMACKAAVKAGDPLTAGEIDALLARRELAERSSHCPHGRPTTLRLSLADLERQFHRR